MMDSAMIGKVEKAITYASQKDRFLFGEFSVTVEGKHDTYTVSFKDNQWSCQCSFFQGRNCCSHTMAVERILQDMLPSEKEF